jgi:hypothetical protein
MPPRRTISANSRKMTDLEETVLVEHILDLDSKGFPPRLCVVEDMANRILATRNRGRVGQRWAETLYGDNQTSRRIFNGNTTTRGLNAKIRR